MPTLTSPIETERVRLRPFEAGDLDALANILARPDVMRYLYEEPCTRQEVAAILQDRVTKNHLTYQGDNLWLAIEEKPSGAMIGSANLLWTSQEHAQGEIGYTLNPDYQRRGYASEAVRALMHYGFQEMTMHRIAGTCDARNDASWRLLERIGMRQEAHFHECEWVKGEWTSQLVYAMLRSEWDQRQA